MQTTPILYQRSLEIYNEFIPFEVPTSSIIKLNSLEQEFKYFSQRLEKVQASSCNNFTQKTLCITAIAGSLISPFALGLYSLVPIYHIGLFSDIFTATQQTEDLREPTPMVLEFSYASPFICLFSPIVATYRVFTRVHNIEKRCEDVRKQISEIQSQSLKDMELWKNYFSVNHTELQEKLNNKITRMTESYNENSQYVCRSLNYQVLQKIQAYIKALEDLQAVEIKSEFRIQSESVK